MALCGQLPAQGHTDVHSGCKYGPASSWLANAQYPQLPGYGRSTPAHAHDKRVIGESVAEALALYLGYNITNTDQIRVILAGHDRGARVAHRLALDISHGIDTSHQVQVHDIFDLAGLVIMDILPTAEQWKILGATSKNMARTFHWPFLANVDLATEMIRVFGGGKWCTEMMRRWSGRNEEGQRSLQRGNAFEVYARYFDQESVIRATSEDYRAGAEEDVVIQVEDQEVSKQLKVPTLVLYSSDYSGKRYGPQMKQIWSWWMADPEQLEVEEITDSGHFIAEEQPGQTYEAVNRFYERVQASQVSL